MAVAPGSTALNFREAMAMFDVFHGVTIPELSGLWLLIGNVLMIRRHRGRLNLDRRTI
jgi:hypothetical protein